jgi:TetR/AcrR family transcriptional repressor of bet genes
MSENSVAPLSVKQKRLRHDERRQQIIETTLACLARDGADGTSLRSVCRQAGVAPSLVTHFFAGWHDLLTAAYTMLTERFMSQLSPLLTMQFPSARIRMDQVILRYLSTDWIGENTIGATMAFWQLARSVVDLRPQFSKSLRDRTRLLKKALSALVEETGTTVDVNELTACLILLLDGIWLELSTNPGNIRETRARQICWFWLDTALAPSQDGAKPPTVKLKRPRARPVP